MRINTPINKERVHNHLTYSTWKYMVLVVLAIFGWSLIYTTTAYRSPENKRIELYVQSNTASSETINAFLEPLWHEVVPEMETVYGVALMTSDDYTASMQMMTYIAASEGDIYFVTEQYFKSFASQGAFLELDELVADGTLDVGDIDLSKGRVAMIEEYDDEGNPALYSQQLLFGIPLDTFYGYMDGMQLDNRGLYAVILANNQNDENVIPFFNALLQAGRGEKPEWIE